MALWLLTWGFVGVSIIVATTSGVPAGTVDTAVQSVGGFYLTAVRSLRQFASATTVSPRWVDVAYAALAAIPPFIQLLVPWIAATIDIGNEVDDFTIGLTFFALISSQD